MKYNQLAKTNLQVSQLSLGTMMFGGQTNESDSLAIMDYAYDQGINVFDTANVYNQGESERIVGKALKGRRDQIILASKVNGQMGKNPNDKGLGRRNILSAVEASLKRLDTDYLDLYYMHAPDYGTDLEESLETMSSLVKSGKARYLGISNFAAWQVADIFAICDKRNYVAPVITQNVYNLITRGIETELLPFLTAHPMGLTIYNPIAAGLLAGKHQPGSPAANTRFANNQMYFDRYWFDANFKAIEELTKIAMANHMTILELAMKWCAAHPQVTTILTGVSRLSQLEQNIASLKGNPINEAIFAQCNEVWHTLTGKTFQYNR